MRALQTCWKTSAAFSLELGDARNPGMMRTTLAVWFSTPSFWMQSRRS